MLQTAGVVLSWDAISACILLNSYDLCYVVPVRCLTFSPSSEGGNLFVDGAATLALLQDMSNCWVCNEMLLLSSSGLLWKIDVADMTM